MSPGSKPVRRVVTGHDELGQSKVVMDGPPPAIHQGGPESFVAQLWVWNESPAPLCGEYDASKLPYDFPAPPGGGQIRLYALGHGRPPEYDPANDAKRIPLHAPTERPAGRTWDRGGRNAFTSDMHKTQTVDYALLLEGERNLVLDDCEVQWHPGDVVIQVGAWHQWTSPSRQGALIAFDMMAAYFADGSAGTVQGHNSVIRGDRILKLPKGVRPARRIVSIDREPGRSSLVSDGPSPDVRLDAARPGYASTRMWVTDSTPAKIVSETLHLPHTIEPPSRGSVLRIVTFPPDDEWKRGVSARDVQAFFRMMGSPGASTYSPKAPHPYMQKTHSLDFCFVLEGEVVLVLDTQEVRLQAGDIVVQRGTNHAWSNRSGNPAVIAIASHDAA